MSIWAYNEISSYTDQQKMSKFFCSFCNVKLTEQSIKRGKEILQVDHCPQCGWWKGYHNIQTQASSHTGFWIECNIAYATLKELDLINIDIPLSDLIDYLALSFKNVDVISPRKFELVVGDVFRNLGYHTVVTNYSNDYGIDVILHDPQSRLIGVQVKKYKNKIEASQIRELTGALMLGNYTKGIFVTTSDFRKGAKTTASLSETKGISIELLNANEFYDALKLSQLSKSRVFEWEDFNLEKFIKGGTYEGDFLDDGTILTY